jgi:hypothetical protein
MLGDTRITRSERGFKYPSAPIKAIYVHGPRIGAADVSLRGAYKDPTAVNGNGKPVPVSNS